MKTSNEIKQEIISKTAGKEYLISQKKMLYLDQELLVEKRRITKNGRVWYSGYYLNGEIVLSHTFYNHDLTKSTTHMFDSEGNHLETEKT